MRIGKEFLSVYDNEGTYECIEDYGDHLVMMKVVNGNKKFVGISSKAIGGSWFEVGQEAEYVQARSDIIKEEPSTITKLMPETERAYLEEQDDLFLDGVWGASD